MQKDSDAALIQEAIRSLAAIQSRLEEIEPSIVGEMHAFPKSMEDSFPVAGLSALYHIMRTGDTIQSTADHLREYLISLESDRSSLGSDTEPMRLTLEEYSSAQSYHFLPPNLTTNTLHYAWCLFEGKKGKHFGEPGGLTPNTGREIQQQRTKEKHSAIAHRFSELHREDPSEFPVSPVGFERAAVVMAEEGFEGISKSTIDSAYLGSIHHKMRGWPKS